MNRTIDNTRPSPIACSELKATLSAYLDDELTRDERIRADTHLVSCGICRDLVERAETLDETLREKFAIDLAAAQRDVDTASVDTRAMQANVLAAIGLRERRVWLPRAAIAAGIAAAVFASIMLWPTDGSAKSLAPGGAGEFAVADRGKNAADGVPVTVPVPTRNAVELASLDADDRQLLYSTGVILTNLRKEGFQNASNRGELSEVARYDELVDRLDALLTKLPTADRPTVALARESIEFLLNSSDEPARWEQIRRDLERTDLDRTVDHLSDV
jgi:Putative zinc-finger